MQNITLNPIHKQLFQVQQPQQSHPLSLRRVLYVKFLRWIDKTPPRQILKALMRVLLFLSVLVCAVVPSFMLGIAIDALSWNTYTLPIGATLFISVWQSPKIWKLYKRLRTRERHNNQHLIHGVPVGALASFLLQHGAFKMEDAMHALALSQGQYAKIGKELEEAGILYRGEKNARILRDITMEQLVMQLRDKYPLVWSEERQVWAERNGSFERWALNHDFKTRKLEEDIEKKERKVHRLERQIASAKEASTFSTLFATVPTGA